MYSSGWPQRWQPLRKLGLAITVGVAVLAGGAFLDQSATARETPIPSVALRELPPEARSTEELIRAGGPFPYEKDGTVFGNRERLLPIKPRGFYREYTVPTPSARDRGARRIVCGGHRPTRPEACFYTDDHYASFRRIAR